MLWGRQHTQLAVHEAIRDEHRGVHVDEERGTRLVRTIAVADGVAEGTPLRLAARVAAV
jgi:hypothetical protein